MDCPFKLISTDFDGTVHSDYESPGVPEPLQARLAALQAEGVRWVINTGRDLSSLMEAMGRAHLKVWPDYVVVVEREIHVRHGSQYVGLEDWNHRCAHAQEALFARVRPDLPGLVEWINNRYSVTIYEDAWSPFCLIAGSNADTDAIMEFLGDYCRRVTELTVVRNDVYARFSHVAFNKGTAIAEIARRLGLAPAVVLAAGDHWNDLPMLSLACAARLIAPDNAVDAVKAAVRSQGGFISAFRAGSGVLDGIEHFLGHRPGEGA